MIIPQNKVEVHQSTISFSCLSISELRRRENVPVEWFAITLSRPLSHGILSPHLSQTPLANTMSRLLRQLATYGRTWYHFHFLTKMASKGNLIWCCILSTHLSHAPPRRLLCKVFGNCVLTVASTKSNAMSSLNRTIWQHHTRISLSLSCPATADHTLCKSL